MHYKITATRLLQAKCEVYGHGALIMCVAMLYIYTYVFNCGENKEPNIS